MRLTPADAARVAEAVAEAERTTSGEIVTIVAHRSDKYHDVALHWAVLVLIATLAIFAAVPSLLHFWFELLFGGWRPEPTLAQLLTLMLVLAVAKFTVALLILKYMPLRLALTPGATKTRRVRRRAIAIFKAGAERRTIGRTGVLIYLSMGEHRAEIVADEAIASRVSAEVWGGAMADMLVHIGDGRVAEGLVAGATDVGAVLAEHFPRAEDDTNELPDRLIEV